MCAIFLPSSSIDFCLCLKVKKKKCSFRVTFICYFTHSSDEVKQIQLVPSSPSIAKVDEILFFFALRSVVRHNRPKEKKILFLSSLTLDGAVWWIDTFVIDLHGKFSLANVKFHVHTDTFLHLYCLVYFCLIRFNDL